MIVTEMGVDPDWSARLHRQLRPAGRRHPHPAHREAHAERPGICHQASRTPSRTIPRFADLRVSFDTGGMVSTALNNGASSPHRHPDRGRQAGRGDRASPARSATASAAFDGVADARVLQRLDAPYLVIDVDRQKAAERRPVPQRSDPAGRGRPQFQHLDRPQLLDRRQERQPVLRGGAVSRKPGNEARRRAQHRGHRRSSNRPR